MADDIARLGIVVETDGVEQAKVSLDDLATSSQQAENRIRDMVARSLSAKEAQEQFAASTRKLSQASLDNARAQTQAMRDGVRQQEVQSKTAQSTAAAATAIRDQQQELARLLGQINPTIAALERLDAQEQKLRNFRATGALDTETFQRFQTTIDQNRSALSGFDDSLRRTGISAKQTQQAIRQLPAQFSDIFISLQAGQSPLTVFLQQGAQIKDSFGGVGPALRETGKALLGLVNPYTLAAAAAGALLLAWKQGSDEAVAYNKALILTGNSAGVTSAQLAGMARSIDEVNGTQANAAAVLAEVAGSGAFAASQIQLVAQAAIDLESATGQAVGTTIEQFKRLGDEPAEAAAKLNEQYNFLTAEVYAQIAALQDQGREVEATQLAFETFSEALSRRSREVNDNLGIIEKGWRAIKSAAAESWDEMLGIGRQQDIGERIQELQRGLNATFETRIEDRAETLTSAGKFGSLAPLKIAYDAYRQITGEISNATDEGRKQNEQELLRLQLLERETNLTAAQEGLRAEANRKSIASQDELRKLIADSATNAEKLAKEYARIDRLAADAAKRGAPLSDEQIQRLRSRAEGLYGERPERARSTRAASAPAVRDDAATRLLLNLREQESALRLQLSTEEKLTSTERERAKFLQQIADLQTKDILTAEQESLLLNKDAIQAQLDRNVAIEKELTLRNDAIKLEERSAQLAQTIAAAQSSREEQQAGVLGSFGLGRQEREIQESFGRIRKEFSRYRDELDKATPKSMLGSDMYKDAVAEIELQQNRALESQRAYYEELARLQQDAGLGASEAIADYVDESSKVGKQVGEVFTKALGGIEDSFVELAMTGKTSFKDLANSIIEDIVRIGTRLLISEALQGFGGMAGGGTGGGGNSTGNIVGLISSFGSLFGGGLATGGPAMAGRLYEVGERDRPELFSSGGKNYLIPGNNGRVTPMGGDGGMSGGLNIGSIVLPGVTNAREARESGAAIARQINGIVINSARYA